MSGDTVHDDYRGFDAREDDRGRGLTVLALALGVLLVFGAVVWNAYRQGIRGSGELPIIAASDSPFKRAPTERQPTTPNTDISAYDQLDGTLRSETVTPVPVREAIVDVPTNTDSAATGSETETLSRPPPETALNRKGTEATTLTPNRPAPTRTAEPLRPDPILAAPPEFNIVPSGGFLVQFMAVRGEAEARTAWDQFYEAHSEILLGATFDIQRADLGSRGIFYRLRVAAFETRPDAGKFCDELKRRGHDCIVVAR